MTQSQGQTSGRGFFMGEVTRILRQANHGDQRSASDLLPLLYEVLRRVAAQKLSRERPGQTLQATALVHEAWLRLMRDEEQRWDSRGHFVAAATEAMRRILVENARRRKRVSHGGGWQRLDFDDLDLPSAMPPDDLLALDEALGQLEKLDPMGAEVVKLRFFAGFTHGEIAKLLDTSLSTVERSWAFSRVWLYEQVQNRAEIGI